MWRVTPRPRHRAVSVGMSTVEHMLDAFGISVRPVLYVLLPSLGYAFRWVARGTGGWENPTQ